MDWNYNEEIRDGFLVSSQRKRLWKIELEILENFQLNFIRTKFLLENFVKFCIRRT